MAWNKAIRVAEYKSVYKEIEDMPLQYEPLTNKRTRLNQQQKDHEQLLKNGYNTKFYNHSVVYSRGMQHRWNTVE